MHRFTKVVAIVAVALSFAAWADDQSASGSGAQEPQSSGEAAASSGDAGSSTSPGSKEEPGYGSYEPTGRGTGSGATANAPGNDQENDTGNFSSGPTYGMDGE